MSIDPAFSRRSFVIGAALAATASLLSPPRLFARGRMNDDEGVVPLMRTQAASSKITTQSLRGGLSVLLGAGGNMIVLPGRDGKLIIDAGLSTAKRQVAAALAAIGADPIRYLVNTHWHFDHTDGNEWLHSEGAMILAQENTRKRLSSATRVDGWNFTFNPPPLEALPFVTFKRDLTLHLNNTAVVLEAFSPAHTDSDIMVEFKEADVVHVADIWWNGHYPFIDYSTGGSIDGTIRAVELVLARVGPSTVIVPGHGPVGDKSQLGEFRDMLSTVRERVAAMKKEGKSLTDIVLAKPTLEYDGKFGHYLTAPATFVGLVYMGV